MKSVPSNLPLSTKARWKAFPKLVRKVVATHQPEFQFVEAIHGGNEWNITFSWPLTDERRTHLTFQVWLYSSSEMLFRVRVYLFDDTVLKFTNKQNNLTRKSNIPVADFLLVGAYTVLVGGGKSMNQEDTLLLSSEDDEISRKIESYLHKFEAIRLALPKVKDSWFENLMIYLLRSPSYDVGANVDRYCSAYALEIYMGDA